MNKVNQSNKIDLGHGNFFIEFFYSIGIDQDLIFDDFLYNSSLDTINENAKINPTIISKFPPVRKPNILIEENIIIKVSF